LIIELNKRYRAPRTLTKGNNTPQCTIYCLKPDKLTTCLEIGGALHNVNVRENRMGNQE